MEKLGAQEGEVITHPLVTRSIGSAQKRVEMQNFEARKRLLEYDDVMNQQREVIYDLRLFALEGGEDLKGEIWEMIEHAIRGTVGEFAPDDVRAEEWDLAGLRNRLVIDNFLVIESLPQRNLTDVESEQRWQGDGDGEVPPEWRDADALEEMVVERGHDAFRRKLDSFGEHQERILSYILLSVIDEKWRDHLYDLDHLKASIGFRGWGQKDPLVEYKQEAYTMFVDLMKDLRKTVSSLTFRAQLGVPQPRPAMPRRIMLSGPSDTPDTRPSLAQPRPEPQEVQEGDALSAALSGSRALRRPSLPNGAPASGPATGDGAGTPHIPGMAAPPLGGDVRRFQTNRGESGVPAHKPVVAEDKVGRNDPCPCGSGKKYKKCHG
jgi:preprotein translocase subunit SecA